MPTSIRRHPSVNNPARGIKPSWLPANLGENATVVMTPGTGDFDGDDQLKRTRDIGLNPTRRILVNSVYYDPTFIIIGADEPYDKLSRGVRPHRARRANRPCTRGNGQRIGRDRNSRRREGGYRRVPSEPRPDDHPERVLAERPLVPLNAAYLIHRDSLIPDDKVIVVVGAADSLFPEHRRGECCPKLYPGHLHKR